MKTVPLGNSGYAVSALCLGTMYFGSTVSEPDSMAILDAYYEAGGRFLDTANKYASWIDGFAGGESESVLGRWMKQRGGRDSLFLATKMGLPMPGVDAGLRAEQIVTECEKSLRRLGTHVIDLFYGHADDRKTPLEESLRAFDSLVKSGKIRAIGLSNYFTWRLAEARMMSQALKLADICCVQLKYSCIHPRPGVAQEFAVQVNADEQALDYCRSQGLTLLAYSPLMGGVFGRDDKKLPESYDNEDNRRKIMAIRRLAAKLNVSANQVVLAWLLNRQKPAVVPVMGVSSVEQLQNNIRALELQISDHF